MSDGSVGYPLSLNGPCDIGTSAQIGELLIRFQAEEHLERVQAVARYLHENISVDALSEYVHDDFLWAVPYFFESYIGLKEAH
jgi:hypothetical protein